MLKKILFSQVSPIIRQGQKKPLVLNDFPELPELWNPETYDKGFDQLNGRKGGKDFIRQVVRILKPQANRLAIMILFMLILKMSSPVLIHELIKTVGLASSGNISLWSGIGTALILCAVQLISAILGQHYVYHAVTSTQSAINGINQRICRSILGSTAADNKKGQVINRASADAELAGASLWAIGEVVQIVLTMIATGSLLFYYLGTAAIAPLVIMTLLMPLSRWFSHRFSAIQGQIMKNRDERIGRMSQFLEGIKVIKSFVWEKVVREEVGKIRHEENKSWKKMANYKAFSTGSYLFASLLVSLIAFGVFVLQGQTLTAATAFTCLTLFGYLEPCFRQLPKILGDVSSSLVAGNRIASLLNDSEVSDHSANEMIVSGVELKDLTVSYESQKNALKEFNLVLKKGESVAIIGPVGSGKTTLLKTILGEIQPEKGTVLKEKCPTAYVPQDPFLFHASLEQNIVLGSEAIDEYFLKQALHASCLDHDLNLLPNGLQTEITEGGGNLSGGQKQRVNLARAAIHSPKLVIMDDPFSALDAGTEKEIVDRLVFGMWKGQTRIVTTHRLAHLKNFDHIIYMDGGSIIAQGSFSDLLLHNQEFQRFYFEQVASVENKGKEIIGSEKIQESAPKQLGNFNVVEVEEQKTGEIALKLYWDYFRAMANFSKKQLPFTIGLLLLTSLSAMLLPILQNKWLSRWTQSLNETKGVDNHHYLLVYAAIGVLTLIVCALQHFYWARKAVDASQALHRNALNGVLSTVLRYFDANPTGRILNRFSRDLDAVEKDLSWSLEEAFMALLNSIGAVFVLLTALPLMGVIVLPVVVLYSFLQKTYRSCMREAKRLMAVARSPRMSSIKEVLDGAAVIRSYKAEAFFQKRFSNALYDYQKAFYGVVLINRWFSIRIPLVSSLLSLAAAIGVILMGRAGNMSEGLAGMTLVYAFRFWDSLNWTVRAFGEAEAQMTSVERLESLASLPKEISAGDTSIVPDQFQGKISFNNVFASYAPHLPNVLKGASFEVPAGAKAGVIGRTGAGKSTLFSLLHRFIECSAGEILIDKININDLPLDTLRQTIGTIPQNPILFSGTIRDNLDPLNEHQDEKLNDLLKKVHLNFLSNGLDTKVSEGGSNFSRGQRQLICLARALVRNAQVIIVDEATASVDGKTDALIRDVLMNECPGITVLIIAHKLQSVSQCDMIIEMGDGKVVSSTHPLSPSILDQIPA